MTDPVVRARLLPENATPRELAIADVDGRFEDLDTDLIRRVRQVEEADAVYLPSLAWERSVDVYDPLWSDEVKRAVIASAPIVHRYKGTRYAVVTALAALKVDADIVEWWQRLPRGVPYTFEVKSYARARSYDGPILDDRLIQTIYSSILRAKPVSRAFGLTIRALFLRRLGLAPIVRARISRRAAMRPTTDARSGTTLGLTGVTLGKVVVRQALLLRST